MTYSIVARDPDTGQLGVAVQTSYFGVGAIVPWAEAGVGVVATQSFAEVSYGYLGLDRMRAGASAPDALAALLVADEKEARRQVAMVDAAGTVAAHTGSRCVPACGSLQGDQVSTQANMMERDSVWGAMLEAYGRASGPFSDRLIAALQAAEREGGDIRGRQSAALLVVEAERKENPWEGRLIDVRVEDHPAPVAGSPDWPRWPGHSAMRAEATTSPRAGSSSRPSRSTTAPSSSLRRATRSRSGED